jgi:hypothetical protein
MKSIISRVLTVIFITTSTLVYAQGGIYDTASTENTPKPTKPPIKLYENTYDEFTKTLRKTTSQQYIGDWKQEKGLHFWLVRVTDPSFGFIHTIGVIPARGLGCSGMEDNYITFLFEDGSVHTLRGDFADVNCSETAGSLFAFRDYAFKPIKKVRFSRQDEHIDVDWNCQYSMQELMDALK